MILEALSNESEELKISISTKRLIDNISIEELATHFSANSVPSWLLEIENIFRKDPVLSVFYSSPCLMNEAAKKDVLNFNESIKKDFIRWNVQSRKIELQDWDFNDVMLGKIVNTPNSSIWYFIDDFADNWNTKTMHHFITLFLIMQLRDQKIDLTRFVNWSLLSEKLELHQYSWFGRNFSGMNGRIMNNSSWQSNRFVAIYIYNHFVKKLWLQRYLDIITRIDPSKIDFYEEKASGFEIDVLFSDNYILTEKELNALLVEFFWNDDIVRDEVREKIIQMNINKFGDGIRIADSNILILPKDKFEETFNTLPEKIKSFIWWFLGKKPRTQIFRERIERIVNKI